MDEIRQLKQEIQALHERNTKVETDKAWETSLTRKTVIAILTYFVVTLFFFVANLPKPFTNAIVPTMGFTLSTLSVPLIKKIWVSKVYQHGSEQ